MLSFLNVAILADPAPQINPRVKESLFIYVDDAALIISVLIDFFRQLVHSFFDVERLIGVQGNPRELDRGKRLPLLEHLVSLGMVKDRRRIEHLLELLRDTSAQSGGLR